MCRWMYTPLSLAVLLGYLLLFQAFPIGAQQIVSYVPYTNDKGETVYLRDFRQPALYSGNFADCLDGGSLIDIARFDVAYYLDNKTVIFRLAGTTELFNQTTTVAIDINAYGQSRFALRFLGCGVGAQGLCPLSSNETILANGVIPITQQEASLIPAIALNIPDFEGEAILRIYSNTTNTQIACYSTTVANGHTFSQPSTVGATLGGFTLVAVIASFAVLAYYDNFKATRNHYAHSVSVLVIFETFQSIYLLGAFHVDWPSVLPAWWSNFAWASGMLYVQSMQNAISNFAGVKQPYDPYPLGSEVYQSITQGLPDTEDGFTWYGYREKGGLPIPGFGTGFGATLAGSGGIIIENAFLTGLLWFLILLATVTIAILVFNVVVQCLAFLWLIDRKSLTYFREHWLTYTRLTILRTIFIAFYVLIFLCIFQFSIGGPAKVEAVAAITFVLVILGMAGAALYAFYYQNMQNEYAYATGPQPMEMEQTYNAGNAAVELKGMFAWHGSKSEAQPMAENRQRSFFQKIAQKYTRSDPTHRARSIHEDREFTERFGWLTGRFRNKTWWFFSAWLLYQFVRGCFLAGASRSPLTQIFGCLIIDVVAFLGFFITKPFEGQRLNTLVAYFLGLTKIVTTILSISFYGPFNVSRIATAAIGIIIIVIQGILTIVLVIVIVTGFVTSYWSVTRNEAKEAPSRRRTKFLDHISADGLPTPRQNALTRSTRPRSKGIKHKKDISLPPQLPRNPLSNEPFFDIKDMRRLTKIDDENSELRFGTDDRNSQADLLDNRQAFGNRNSTYSMQNTLNSERSFGSLPFGARNVYRSSWSSRDFGEWDQRQVQDNRELLDNPSSAFSNAALLPRRSGDDYAIDMESPYTEHDMLPLPQAYPYVNRSSRVFSVVTGDRRSLTSYEVPSLVRPRTGASDILSAGSSHRNSLVPRVSFTTDSVQEGPTPPPHKYPVSKSSRELPRHDDRRWEGQRFHHTDLPIPRYEGPPPPRFL